MADRNKPVAVPSVENTEEPGVTSFHIRGRHFVIREMTAGEYEEQIRAASTGEDQKTDVLVLEKLLVMKSVTIDGQPVTDVEEWAKEPYPVASRVVDEVKRMHWLNVETDEEIEENRKAAERAEREARKSGTKGTDIPNS